MTIYDEIMKDPNNIEYTIKGWHPIYQVNPKARLLIIGQAPGKKVQETEIMWNDASGVRLRDWLGISKETFYQSKYIAVIPMDFYYPGKGRSGDNPPRPFVAEKWHDRLIQTMPDLKLIILIGAYAQKYYLHLPTKVTISETIANYQKYLPRYFPIVHPSPRNNIWLKKNSWFEDEIIPILKEQVKQALVL